MALLFFDSFSHYATAEMGAKWSNPSGTITTGAKRTGTTGLHHPTAAEMSLPDASGNVAICGSWMRFDSFNTAQPLLAPGDSQGVTGAGQCMFCCKSDGTPEVRLGGVGGTVIGSAGLQLSTGTWYFIELKQTIDNAAGSVQLRVNGTAVVTATGVDTQSTSNASFNGILLGGSTADYADLYVCDGAGSINNDFIGYVLAEPFVPRTDATEAGHNAGLTPSTGTDHGALVDEATPNGDTDYNSGTTIGVKDTYRFSTLTSTGGVLGVQTLPYARKLDQVLKTIAAVIRHAGADYDGTSLEVGASYDYRREVFETNPGTGLPWTGPDVNAIEAGLKIADVTTAKTKYYLLNVAAPYTPATIRGAWDQTAGAVTKALSASKVGGGATTSVAIAETSATNPFNVLLGRWVSGPLAAQTISGTLNVVIAVLESAAAADMNWHLHVYVTQGDSDTPRGTLLTDYTEALGVNEWPTVTPTFKALNAAAALSSLAITAGDRMVVEIGYVSREAAATSRTGTLRYGTLSATMLTELADGAPAGTDGTLKAGYLSFSVGLTEATTTIATRLSQMVLEVLSRDIPVVVDPPGDGDPGAGTDPADGGSLCGAVTPLHWITVQTDAGQQEYSEGDIPIGATFKEARLLGSGGIVRALSDQEGRFETAHVSYSLSDHDRLLRGMAGTGTLLNKRVDDYLQSAAQMRAAGTPRRTAQLVIRDFQPDTDLTFTIQCEDYFGSVLGEFGAPRMVPSRTFALADFPHLPSPLIGKAVPIAYGLLSDESRLANATGVVPCLYVGPRRLSDGQDWDEYVICGHAVAAFQSWFASNLVGQPIDDPDNPGETIDSAFPSRVEKVDPALEGTEFLIPGHTGWTAIVGAPTYVDYNGHRYTVIFARGLRSDDAKSGAVPMSINIGGIEDVGDGSGVMIDSLPRQIQHFINAWWLGDYQTGNWPAIPMVNSYSRINTASFEAVRTESIARVGGTGYIGAFLLGWDQGQQPLSDVLKQFAQDCDCDFGINQHGQIIASAINALTTPTRAFVDPTDIVAGSFTVRRKVEYLTNAVVFRFMKNYILDASADSARTGAEWMSDAIIGQETIDITDPTSIAAVAETRKKELFGWSTRHKATALDVATHLLGRNSLGPIYATFKTDLCGLDVELGDNITVTHFAGMSASGWTAKVLRVERLVLEPAAMTVELTGQVV